MSVRVIVATSILMFVVAQTKADVVVFTDSNGWLAATDSVLTEDFEDTSLVPNLTVTTDNGVISDGVWNDSVDDPILGSNADTTWVYGGAPSAWSTEIDLNPGGAGSGLDIRVTYTDLTNQTFDEITTSGFWGFVSSDKAISEVNISTTTLLGLTQEQFAFDNMSSGIAATAVPEPGTSGLLLAVGGWLIGRRRRMI